jgi:hypothetical protein
MMVKFVFDKFKYSVINVIFSAPTNLFSSQIHLFIAIVFFFEIFDKDNWTHGHPQRTGCI